jgi:hypothetical protein
MLIVPGREVVSPAVVAARQDLIGRVEVRVGLGLLEGPRLELDEAMLGQLERFGRAEYPVFVDSSNGLHRPLPARSRATIEP